MKWRIPKIEITFYTTWRPGLHNRFPDRKGTGRKRNFFLKRSQLLMSRDFYVSPLGRAKDTASCTLKKNGRTATECKWLREFDVKIRRPDLHGEKIIPWDWLPQDWTKIENFYSFDRWWDNDILREGKMKEEYDWVTQNFEKVLAEHGYVREGHYYRAEKANEDTLVFFCHFGVSCVLISYLLSISPLVMLQNFCAAPSSVSTIVTEERRKGIASFRMSSFGRHFSFVCASGAAGFCCQIL